VCVWQALQFGIAVDNVCIISSGTQRSCAFVETGVAWFQLFKSYCWGEMKFPRFLHMPRYLRAWQMVFVFLFKDVLKEKGDTKRYGSPFTKCRFHEFSLHYNTPVVSNHHTWASSIFSLVLPLTQKWRALALVTLLPPSLFLSPCCSLLVAQGLIHAVA
jgi:hypothetical protein